MLDRIEQVAHISIGRGCGFAGLAIFTTMFAFSGEPVTAFKVGGVLTLGVALILVLRATRAQAHPYKRTEVWVMLDPEERPKGEVAQRVIGQVLRETYLKYAVGCAGIAGLMLVIAFGIRLVAGLIGA